MKTINKSVKRHPKVRYVVVATLRSQQMKVNPTYQYLESKKPLDSEWIQEHYIDKLKKKVKARVDTCESYDELLNGWFGTDIHWNLRRALESYNWIAKKLDLKKASWNESKEVPVTSSWAGTNARFGRDLDITSELVDQDRDFSQLSYYELEKDGKGEPYTPGLREAVIAGTATADDQRLLQFDAYTHYFGNAKAMYIENNGKNNGKTCLLVCDSFGYCLHRYIARNYEKTIVIFPGNNTVKHKLNWYIDRCGANDVIFLTHGKKYSNIAKNSPNFIAAGRK